MQKSNPLFPSFAAVPGAAALPGRPRQSLKNRRFVRSNIKYARRSPGWVSRLKTHLLRETEPEFKVIPVRMRPWVPANRAILARGGFDAMALAAALRERLPGRQYDHLLRVYPALAAADHTERMMLRALKRSRR